MAATGRSERSEHSIEQPEIIDRSDSKNSEGTVKEFPLSPTKQLGYGSSSSLNLLELSDFVQVDAHINQSEAGTICLGNPDHVIYQLQFKDDESDASSISSAKSEKGSGFQGTFASQVSDITPESVRNVLSPTQSPPLQTMDRAGEYDPFRIPSAVFQRSRSITPLEWSIASNESLFSINVGNNSLSRDHVFRLSDLGKPDELTKSGELFVFNPPPTVITSRETEKKSAEFEKDTKMEDTAEYTVNDKEGVITRSPSERKGTPPAISWNSSNVSRHSDRSQSSSNSFAFPIKKKCACSSCYCSNCSQAFCYKLWPSCYCTWPCCCCWNCSRPFCYCWNCSQKGLSCDTSNILADEEAQAGSVPGDAKKKHQDTSGAAVPSKSSGKSWFPCCYSLSCCTWSCCSCSSCCKWNCCSCSSCCKLSFCSCSSCCKLSFCSYSSCCAWSLPSCSSCCTWSCHFHHCCHFSRCRHFFPSCQYRPRYCC